MPVQGNATGVQPGVAGRRARPRARVKRRDDDESLRRLERQVRRATASKRKPVVETRDVRRRADPKAGLRNATADLARTARKARVKAPPSGLERLRRDIAREAAGKGSIVAASESVARAAGPVAARLSVLGNIPGAKKYARRFAEDVVNVPAQAVPSVYVPVAAAFEAAKSGGKDTERAGQFLKDIEEQDPVYALVTGRPREALKRAGEHPGFAALEVLGIKGAGARGVTRVQEAKAKAQGRPKASVTARAPGKVPGTNVEQPRTYSRDALTRRRQRRRDDAQRERARRMREAADDMERRDPGNLGDQIADLRRRANAADPDRADMAGTRRGRTVTIRGRERQIPKPLARPSYIKHRVRQTEAANEMRRRQGRTEADREVRAALRAGDQKASAADVLYAQAITDRTPASMRAYLQRIEAIHDSLPPAKRADNRALQKAIRDALRKGVDPESVRAVATAYEKAMAPRTEGLRSRGMLSPESAEMAPLIPHAVAQMGARHTMLDPLKGAEAAARANVRKAKAVRARTGRAVSAAQRKAAKEEGRTRLLVQQGRRDAREAASSQYSGSALRPEDLEFHRARYAIDAGQAERWRSELARLEKGASQVGHRQYSAYLHASRLLANAEAAAASHRAAIDTITAPTRSSQGAGKSPVKALARLERARDATLAAERAHAQARESVPAAKAAARKARAARREARGPGLAIDGRRVTAAQIRESIGDRPVAYVSQAPKARNPYYVDTHTPPGVPRARRTGKATEEGTFRGDPEVMRESVVRAQGLIDAFDGFKATIAEWSNPETAGKLRTKLDADRKGAELEARTGMKWRAVRINPFAGRQEQLQALLDHANADDLMHATQGERQPLREALESALSGEDGAGPWALIPEEAAAELAQFARAMGAGTGVKALQIVGQMFRSTVLALSFPWLVGNPAEASIRTALFGALNPASFRTGHAFLARLAEDSPELAADLRRRAAPGGLMQSAKTLHLRRGHEQFEGTMIEPLANALHWFFQKPGGRHAADAWKAWTNAIFGGNGLIESQFQTAMLGKAIRSNPLFEASELKTLNDVVDAAAKGMIRDPNKVAAAADIVTRAYGRYHGHSPGMRWQIATYTPFVPWYLNAVKFITDVLPRDHPAALALLAATENATEEWRRDQGLSLFIEGRLPGFKQGSIPTGGGHHLPLSRFTPFGAFGDPLGTLKRQVLPQFSGVLAAFDGEDWKGAKLRNADGSEMDDLGKARYAAQEFLNATIPAIMLVERASNPETQNPARTYGPPKRKPRARARRAPSSSVGESGIDWSQIQDAGGSGIDWDAIQTP